jgi:hypothetical protein
MLKREKDARPAPGKKLQVSHGRINPGSCIHSSDAHSLRDTSLPWEILEAANTLFQRKGFERTTITDICRRLGIKPFQFYNHFGSLDEVLEILWAR